MKKSLFFSVLIFIAACTATKVTSGPTEADATRGASKYPGLTVADLNQGKALYEENCGSCHGLKKPQSESESEWNKIVPVMVKKTNKKAGKEVLDTQKQDLILKYLVTMSTAK